MRRYILIGLVIALIVIVIVIVGYSRASSSETETAVPSGPVLQQELDGQNYEEEQAPQPMMEDTADEERERFEWEDSQRQAYEEEGLSPEEQNEVIGEAWDEYQRDNWEPEPDYGY